ncbi:MAG: hypothetical protein AAB579_02315 [Patescibacteria group bacterium]
MKLDELINKHKLNISKEIKDLCELGIEHMTQSVDPLHDQKHVFNLHELLDKFLTHEKSVSKTAINFDVLLPAIAWHDIWKSRRPQTYSMRKYVYEQIIEGRGSVKLFRKHTKSLAIPNDIYKKIQYCIYYHPPVSDRVKHRKKFRPDKLEAHLLKDIDALAFWSWNRADHFKATYCNDSGVFHNPRMLQICQWIYKKSPKHLDHYYFDWSRKEYEKRSTKMMKEAKRIIDINCGILLQKNQPLKHPLLRNDNIHQPALHDNDVCRLFSR